MRILIVSHPPLTGELGAAQTALQLAAALRDRGHDASAWSPEPLPPGVRWWNIWRRQRVAIETFVTEHGPFDVIDTPASTASRNLARQGRLIVRSIQPELLYLWQEIHGDMGKHLLPSPRSLAHAAVAAPRSAAIVSGWRHAHFILCLGSIELTWMRRHFPRWQAKLGSYVCAPPPSERLALNEVRRRRPPAGKGNATRFLWIGRWSSQKGLKRLLSWIEERLSLAPNDTITLAGCGLQTERDLRPEWLGSGRVRVVPSFSRTELLELLAAHDAGVFTSNVEGWGLTLNEMLESGLPVFATETGGVADLQPFFPQSLHPFPPPVSIEPSPLEDLEANGYFARFNWPAIARSYEETVLGPRLHGG